MKNNVFKNIFRCIFILAFMVVPFIMSAQGLASDPGDPGCEPLDPACPIDGGLSALLAIGAGYGIKKIRDARKAVNPE